MHYHCESIGRNQWRVIHTASRCVVTPLGMMNSCTKAESLGWRDRCQHAAPTDDPNDASKSLIAAGIPQDWHARAMMLV